MDPGNNLLGPFDLLAELGRGAAGSVFRARHRELGREVAVKVLTAPATRKARALWLARLRREAEALARVEHPNIVRVHALHDLGSRALLELELVRGEPLSAHVERAGGALPPAQALALVEKLARAAHHAHEHGIVHRDLKPDNVLIDERGEPRIVDFGMAKDLESLERLSQTGALMGTPSYFAPEQARGAVSEVDGRTDVWALGVILYELISGELPFRSSGLLELIVHIAEHAPPPPRLPGGGDPGPAAELVMAALRKDRAERPSALELAEGCAAARRPHATGRRRGRGVVLATAAGAAALGVLAALGVALTRSAGAPGATDLATDLATDGRPRGADAAVDRASEFGPRLARALDEPDGGRLAACATDLARLLAADPELRAPLVGVLLALPEAELLARFGLDRPSTRDDAALAELLRAFDHPDLAPAARAGLEARRAALSRQLADHARARLARAAALGPDVAGSGERAVALDHLWRMVALGDELDAATLRATLDLFELAFRRLPAREALEVHALLLALGEAPLPLTRDAPFTELHAAAADLVRARPDALGAQLAAATACLEAATRQVIRAREPERPAALREARALLAAGPLEWLEAFRTRTAAPELAGDAPVRAMRAVERFEWARALLADVAQPADRTTRASEAMAAALEALELGYPRHDKVELLLAARLLERAEPLLDADAARAWSDLEQAAERARRAAAFLHAARVEQERLVADPPEEPAGMRRVAMFVTTRLAAQLTDVETLARPAWVEVHALTLQDQLPGFRDPDLSRTLRRRALEAGLAHVPDEPWAAAALAEVLVEQGERAAAIDRLERLLALDPADPAWSRAHRDTRGRAERLLARLRGE